MSSTRATAWRDKALMCHVAEQDAHHEANKRASVTDGDPWAGEYARKLRDIKHLEAAVHREFAKVYDDAYLDAKAHEKAGAA